MLASTRVLRNIKRFNSEETFRVDPGQGWKLVDLSKNDVTKIFFNGPSAYTKEKTGARVLWVETNQGPFLLETDSDIEQASKLINISVEEIKKIISLEPKDFVKS
jgi:hypothetical protein